MSRAIQRYQARKDGEAEFGFTLIELLIVIVVLGILAAVTVFALSGTTSKSAAAACSADGSSITTAVAAYEANTSSTPPVATTAATWNGYLVTAYLSSMPINGSHYGFQVIGSGTVQVQIPFVSATTGTWVNWTATSCSSAT
jgi:prepilin-type N-terminal cleavage/methylation domain-containing protein